jgi:hypothetical protein
MFKSLKRQTQKK